MKSIFKSRIFAVLVTLAVTLSVIGGIAWASTPVEDEVNTSVNIVAETSGMTFYSDAACTEVIETLSWGDVERNDIGTTSVFVMNTGNYDLDAVTFSTTFSPTVAAISFSTNTFALAQDEVVEVQISIAPSLTATLGTVSPVISVDAMRV